MKTIRVILDQFYCPTGCCRLDLYEEPPICRLFGLLQQGKPHFVHGTPNVRFAGAIHEEERGLLFEAYGFGEYPMEYGEATTDVSVSEGGAEESDASSEDGQDSDIHSEHNDVDIDMLNEDSAADSQSTNDDDELDAQYEEPNLHSIDLEDVPVEYNYEVLRMETRRRSRSNHD